MGKLKRYLAAFLCAALLLGGILLPQALGAPTTVYLLAVGDKMYDPPGNTLPVSVDGVIYIPYNVFDRSQPPTGTGWNLGVYYGFGQGQGPVLTLYSADKRLIFTYKMGICEDQDGNSMSFRAVERNGIPYVPGSAVCKFFGLNYSFLPTSDRGTLIRIANDTANMSDSFFMSVAQDAMLSRYENLTRGQNPQPSASPSPSATPTPTPTPSVTPSGSGKENVRVYLAVDASAATGDLTQLFPAGVRALFLFAPDALADQSELVRKVVAAGHSVGLTVEGSLEEALDQLEKGNDLLSHIARVRTHMAAVPDSLVSALTEQGWRCWQTNTAGDNASTILANLDLKRTVGRIELPANSFSISQVIARIRSEGYDLRQPLETDY